MAMFALFITFILVIGLHEIGHAIAAVACGVKIKRISLGFGKPLFSWRYKACEWVLARWPLGGYVQLVNSRIEKVEPSDVSQSFEKQSIGLRCIILLAGAMANLLVTLLAFFFFFKLGYQQPLPIIGSVRPNSIAAKAGLSSQTHIISVANSPTDSWQTVAMQVIRHIGDSSIPVETASHLKLSLDLSQGLNRKSKSLLSALGITPSLNQESRVTYTGLPWNKAWIAAIRSTSQCFVFFLIMIKQLLLGAIPFSLLLGPLSMLAITIHSFSQGLAIYFFFLGTLSLAVATVNLLPIPSLDGGSILYALIEKVRGKPISIALEVLIHRLVMIFLCIFFIQLVLNDLVRYFL